VAYAQGAEACAKGAEPCAQGVATNANVYTRREWSAQLPAPLLGIVADTVSIWAVNRGWGDLSGLEGGLNRLGELFRWEAVRAIRREAESVARKARL